MIVRMGFLQKREGMSVEAFREHWFEVHGPLAAKIPGLRRYHQNLVVDSAQLGIEFRRGSFAYDGFSELWFDDVASMQEGLSADIVEALAEDEARFIGSLQVVVFVPHIVIPVPTEKGGVKRMAVLTRRKDVSAESFQNEWWNVHTGHVLQMPGVEGYIQNLVIDRSFGRKRRARYEQMPIDGMVELWFKDIAHIEAAFGSPQGKTTMAHAKTFIEEITTFLVETNVVV